MADEDLSRESAVVSRAMWEAYREFEQKKPKPRETVANRLAFLGWEFWLMGATALAATVLTALRTGTAFYTAAVGKFLSTEVALQMNQASGGVEAFAAVLAYEGLLLGVGLRDGKNRYRKSYTHARADGKEAREIVTDLNSWFKWLSVGLALVTSITAGGAVSANIIPNLDPAVRDSLLTFLTVLMALASVLAFTTGELLGMMYEEANVRVDLKHDDFGGEVHAWEEERERYWNSKRMEMIARVDPGVAQEIRARSKTGGAPRPAGQPARKEISMPQAAEVLTWYLKRHGLTVHDDISSKDIAEEAMREAYKDTDIEPDPQETNALASSLRMALSRERKKNGNGNGHVAMIEYPPF